MTRATKVRTTPEGERREIPTRRLVLSKFDGEMVAEAHDRILVLRPKGCRRGGKAEVTTTWGQIYNRVLEAQALERIQEKRRAAKARKRQRRGGR